MEALHEEHRIKIKKAYSDLQQLGNTARITVKAGNNMLYNYPVYGDLA